MILLPPKIRSRISLLALLLMALAPAGCMYAKSTLDKAKVRRIELPVLEHGPQGGDKLNLLVPGGNYGWPQVSYGVEYGSKVNVPRAAEVGLHNGFTKPVFAWVPSIGISSLIVNDERLFPLWRDDLLIGSLSGTQGSGYALFRVRRDGTDVQYVERIEVGNRIRDLAQMPDRRLALLLDGGRIHFLSRSYAHCADELRESVYAVDCGEGGP